MVTQSQVARFAAISKATRAPAANANAAPKGTLSLAPFMAKLQFDAIEAGTTAEGAPFFKMPDVSVEKPDGSVLVRTVMAFDDAHAMVREVILGGHDLEVELTHAGPTMKVTGVVVDGAFRKVAVRLPKAA